MKTIHDIEASQRREQSTKQRNHETIGDRIAEMRQRIKEPGYIEERLDAALDLMLSRRNVRLALGFGLITQLEADAAFARLQRDEEAGARYEHDHRDDRFGPV